MEGLLSWPEHNQGDDEDRWDPILPSNCQQNNPGPPYVRC